MGPVVVDEWSARVHAHGRVGAGQRGEAVLLAASCQHIISSGDERILESHRKDIAVVFCDLRGFTPVTEAAEAEEVMSILQEYHAAMGRLVFRFEGTLEHFAGDGFMVFFNDPLKCPDPSARAVRMSVAMRASNRNEPGLA
jgi:class 3 adenylate cyclase